MDVTRFILNADTASTVMVLCKSYLNEILPICPKFSKTYTGGIEGTIYWDSTLGRTIEIYNMAENIFLGRVQEYRVRRFPSCL